MSIGADLLRIQLLNIFGSGLRIEPEFQVGESLRLDYYLPDYKLGIEWHGRQHKEFVEHFHRTADGFRDAQRRDRRKLELCAEKGIAVAVFWDDEEITQEIIVERIKGATSEENTLEEETIKNPLREKIREAAKAQYQKYKQSEAHRAYLEKARKARKEQYEYSKQRKNKDKN
jgi:hypothetical protein